MNLVLFLTVCNNTEHGASHQHCDTTATLAYSGVLGWHGKQPMSSVPLLPHLQNNQMPIRFIKTFQSIKMI